VVPSVASTARLLAQLAHTKSNKRYYSCLADQARVADSQWRLKYSGDFGTRGYCDGVDFSMTCLSFTSFNAPYNLVRLIYEIRTASSQFLILRLIIRCALWTEKYGTQRQWSALNQVLSHVCSSCAFSNQVNTCYKYHFAFCV